MSNPPDPPVDLAQSQIQEEQMHDGDPHPQIDPNQVITLNAQLLTGIFDNQQRILTDQNRIMFDYMKHTDQTISAALAAVTAGQSFKLTKLDIPKFDGEKTKFDSWITQVKTMKQAANLPHSDEQFITLIVQPALTEAALDWYTQLFKNPLHSQATFKSWDLFVTELANAFTLQNSDEYYLRELDALKYSMNTPFPTFVSTFNALIARLGRDNEPKSNLDAFIKKLPDWILARLPLWIPTPADRKALTKIQTTLIEQFNSNNFGYTSATVNTPVPFIVANQGFVPPYIPSGMPMELDTLQTANLIKQGWLPPSSQTQHKSTQPKKVPTTDPDPLNPGYLDSKGNHVRIYGRTGKLLPCEYIFRAQNGLCAVHGNKPHDSCRLAEIKPEVKPPNPFGNLPNPFP